MLSACLRRYPRGRSFPAAVSRLGPRRRLVAPGGVRADRRRGPGSTAVRSQHAERPHRPMCSRGYDFRSSRLDQRFITANQTNRGELCSAKLDQAFNASSAGIRSPNPTNPLSAKSTFFALERALKKETSKWWEAGLLKKYLEHDLIPRGLRILIFPPTDTTSQERLQQWEANLQMASNNMIRQLIDIAQEEYEKYRQEVDTLNKRIEEANWGDISVKNYEILIKIIDYYEKDIIQRKNRKFRRDLTDYQLGRVYTFGKQYDNIKDSNPISELPSCSETLSSSDAESSEEVEKRQPNKPTVNLSEAVRRHRLGTTQDNRTRPPGTTTEEPKPSGIQTRARSKEARHRDQTKT
ncbi:hypothetical protein NDU88_003913 [Pleurodeles waltl]|uniref:Uncharacterized protein n=1 Tax=Pleurodeles waltl TaxID=8319 RepID=A0AAV7TQY5_PLEWA|nr:hypothetical protein NDU88_003913 [Pleurodeles waltl]